jgi:hypothetical protein
VQGLTYAFRFIRACFSLALKNPRLRKPGLYLLMGGVSVLVVWIFPLGVVTALLGVRPLAMALIGLFAILLLFVLLAVGEAIAMETCLVFDDLIRTELPSPEINPEKRSFTHWGKAFLWALILPGLHTIQFVDQVFRPKHASKRDWLGAAYLMLPVISIEDRDLKDAQERITDMVRNHLVRFHPDLVRVRLVAGVVQWTLILCGGALGVWAGLAIAGPEVAGVLARLLAIAIGLVLGGIPALLGIGFGGFCRACYYTSLYQWALNVAFARLSGDTGHSLPPAILSQVLRTTHPSKKEEA